MKKINDSFLDSSKDKKAAAIINDPVHGEVLDARFGALRVPWYDNLATPRFTVEVWAKPRHNTEWLVSCQPPDRAHPWVIAVGQGGDLAAFFPGAGIAWYWNCVPVNDGQWHHLAMTVDGQTPQFFVDGRLTPTDAGSQNKPHTIALEPGLHAGTDSYFANAEGAPGGDGLIHAIRISRGIRAITSDSDGAITADEATIGLWNFNHVIDGTFVRDESGQGGDGTLSAVDLPEKPLSLDAIDRHFYAPGPGPMEGEASAVTFLSADPGLAPVPTADSTILDGQWEMAEDGDDESRLAPGSWDDAIPAAVPGSVHAALQKAGKIPDPKGGRNDAMANRQSFKTWWCRTYFPRPVGARHRLVFDGVAIRCSVWLNGTKLGEHEGMFGGPSFDIAALLRDRNELVVKLDPAPHEGPAGMKYSSPTFEKANNGWRKTVVFNNVYGWHYSNIPSLGIWRSVRVEAAPTVRLLHPFVATEHAADGKIHLVVDLQGPATGWAGKLTGMIRPHNFTGKPLHFEWPVRAAQAGQRQSLRLQIPDVELWWPNGYGKQSLYQLNLRFTPEVAGTADEREVVFGVRTIEMGPGPEGTNHKRYNWTFIVNGRPLFIKGTGWCTLDSSMDFSAARYERFLQMAKDQHCQMVRAWGSGMPETDEFYDACDRLGLLVMQEWPTAWNSHADQPYEVLEETVRLNTLRLRNHPSLAMWGGGNESNMPFGKAIDMMGRLAVELDGTRPFHRGEPWGGSTHNYDCWWGKAPLDANLQMTSLFFGEFGIASMPVMESVMRYLPEEERHEWPPREDGSFAYHTPVFNRREDVARLRQYAGYFTEGRTLERFIAGSQLAQCVALRHTLERARTRWPEATGALLYKLNDNYPAASWATADWYGATKLSHWFVQDAFAPVTAVVLFESVNNVGKALALPVFLLDDTAALGQVNWRVRIRAFDGKLKQVKETIFDGAGAVEQGRRRLGTFDLTAEETQAVPLLVVSEVEADGRQVHRTFYFVNYEAKKDSLFELPATTYELAAGNGVARVTNTGLHPAVGVTISRPGHADTFSADDNAFWLDPGESRTVAVNSTDGLAVEAFNKSNNPELEPAVPGR
ncbi:MAG: LamG-like jellyroll fold domain-containing protein [bacterium]